MRCGALGRGQRADPLSDRGAGGVTAWGSKQPRASTLASQAWKRPSSASDFSTSAQVTRPRGCSPASARVRTQVVPADLLEQVRPRQPGNDLLHQRLTSVTPKPWHITSPSTRPSTAGHHAATAIPGREAP